MKRIVMFSLSVLLLVLISMLGSGGNAFATTPTPPPADVVILVCSTATSAINVSAFSVSTSVTSPTIAVGDSCAQDLALLINAGLRIRNVQTTTTGLVYTLVSGEVFGKLQ
jgi:hypothetical protein